MPLLSFQAGSPPFHNTPGTSQSSSANIVAFQTPNRIPRPPSQALLPQVGSSPGHDQMQMSEDKDKCTQRSSFADPWQPHLLLGPRPLLSPTTAFFIFSHRHSMGPKLSSGQAHTLLKVIPPELFLSRTVPTGCSW